MKLSKGQKIILVYIPVIIIGSFFIAIVLSLFNLEKYAPFFLKITTFGIISLPISFVLYLFFIILKRLTDSQKKIIKKIFLIILGLIFAGVLLLFVLYLNSFEYKMKQQEKMIEKWKASAIQNESKIFKDVNIITNQVLSNPAIIQGSVNFHWFPEGWFEIYLVDESGNEISKTVANANVYPLIPNKEGYMPFIAEISFETSKTEGTLVFKKYKYSELNIGDYTIPVKLK